MMLLALIMMSAPISSRSASISWLLSGFSTSDAAAGGFGFGGFGFRVSGFGFRD